MKISHCLIIALLVVFVAAQAIGGKKEHKGEPTAEHRRAIQLVLDELEHHQHEVYKLVKINSIHEQVVSGKRFFFNICVSCVGDEYDVEATVYRKHTGELEIHYIHEHKHSGGHHPHEELTTEDMKRGFVYAMERLTKMNQEEMLLVKFNSIHSQIVSGASYTFDMQVQGKTIPEYRAVVVVHHKLDDKMEIIRVTEYKNDTVQAKSSWRDYLYKIYQWVHFW